MAECTECGATEDLLKGHPDYILDLYCRDCMIQAWEEKKNEAEDMLDELEADKLINKKQEKEK